MDNKQKHIKRYKRILSVNPGLLEISNNSYLTNAKVNEKEEIIRGVIAYVLAPSLNAFVLWVLMEAVKRNQKRLYFLARDGYLMYCYAKRYVEYFNLPIECRYLYCSRYALRVPMYHMNMDEMLSYVTLDGLDVTLDKIMNRAALDEKQKNIVFNDLKLPYGINQRIPKGELSDVRNALKNSSVFMNLVEENSKKALPLLQKYIEQEGLLEDIPMAIVDSGWVGSMQKQLNILIKETIGADLHPDLEGYYFGLYDLPEDVDPRCYHTFYFSPNNMIKRKVYFSNCLFEGIFSAPHGMTLGYQLNNGQIIPIIDEISLDRVEFLKITEGYLKKYQEKYIDYLNIKCDQEGISLEAVSKLDDRLINLCDYEMIVYKLLKEFMGKPYKEEAEVYGQVYFSDDILEYGGKTMAEKLSFVQLWQNHLSYRIMCEVGIVKGPIKQSAWYEGSSSLCSNFAIYHRMSYVLYKYIMYYRKRNKWRKSNGN